MDVLGKNALMKKVRDRCKPSRCLRCGFENGTVKKAPKGPLCALGISHEFNRTSDKSIEECRSALPDTKGKAIHVHTVISPLTVLSLFKRMPDEDCELLNLYGRPERFLVTDIAVPPIPVRPSAFVGSGSQTNENDLTSMLRGIINSNTNLRSQLQGGSPYLLDNSWAVLQMQVIEYINSESPSVVDAKHRGLIQRLKGKTGRFRGNLSGKRVEFTGRTVISPDPNLKISEVGIPVLMARVLVYPERVSSHNIEKLRQCVRNGPSKYPGANFVVKADGARLHLKYVEKKSAANELKYGEVVERHLEDGDIVLFNRQPSLHRMSIMSHRARIMPWRTLRFNESVCNPYNADFDGDEMNMHVPQTEEARTEAFMLMGVQNNLCTPKNGEILVASTQDFLTSSFLITRKDTFYDRAAFSLMCSYIVDGMDSIDLPTPALLKPIELWTGKQLFSVLLRPNARTRVFLTLTVHERIYEHSETMCPKDGCVYFRNSELICGQLGKVTLGNGNKNGLFSVLLRDYNPHVAATCMNRLAKLSARWIGNHGFSIGIDDVQPGDFLIQQKKKTVDEGYRECNSFISSYSAGKLALKPGCDAAKTLEFDVTEVLNTIREKAGKVCMESLHWRNSPLIMSQCGSKGSMINISQMIACVGQQSVGGRRAPNGFIDRTLPHFPIHSKTPAAKGFVANSFYSGLTATEFFFHTMGGREGLVDTAVKTAETGYMSRRLMKGLEDLSLYYDQTVRNASGGVVQFLYGDDGMDPAKMEEKDSVTLNLNQLYMKVTATCPSRRDDSLSRKEIREITDERLSKYDVSKEGGCSDKFRNSLSSFLHQDICGIAKREDSHLDDRERAEKKIVPNKIIKHFAANINGVSSKQLQVFLETCISRYHKKKIEPGTAIGAIGAQSIGEPGTQMTLKTFHFAGVASMNVTLGVPRIKEIVNAAKKINTPIITAALFRDDTEDSARLVKTEIERTVLGEVAETMKIVLNSRQPHISIKLDRRRMQALHMRYSSDSIIQSILSHPKMKSKMDIKSPEEGTLTVVPLVKDRSQLYFELHSLKSILPNVVVKGISTVDRAVISNDKGKYNLLVEGTNLLAVMGSSPGVNASETKSNHVIEVQDTLGIEAARQSIINEIQYTMKSHGMSIDVRHMMLLGDVMTYKGKVLGLTRFGITEMKDSVLMLASFEKTSEHLFNGSFNGRDDQIEGVSECIIMGIPMQLGTGILKVRQRVEKLPELKYMPDPLIC